jgi:hypothetical protein
MRRSLSNGRFLNNSKKRDECTPSTPVAEAPEANVVERTYRFTTSDTGEICRCK